MKNVEEVNKDFEKPVLYYNNLNKKTNLIFSMNYADYVWENGNRYVIVDSELAKKALGTELTDEFRSEISSKGTRIIEENHGVVWKIPYSFYEGTCFIDNICVNMGQSGNTQLSLENNSFIEGENVRYILERKNTESKYDHEGALLTLMNLWISFVNKLD